MNSRSSRKSRLHRRKGFTILEVGIAATLSAMLMSGALLFLSDYLKGQAAQSEGQTLNVINNAVNQYEAKYATQLANNQAITIPGYGNVANIYSPTLTELFELGMLANSTPAGMYGIKIGSTLVGGVPSGLTWITSPFVNQRGEVDQSLAGAAMLAAGGDAGMSTSANPAVVLGSDGWTANNPVSGSPAGILAMRNGAGSGAYVRLDGSTPMQGSLNLNSFNVTNGGTLSAATVNATTANDTTLTATTANAGTLNATTANANQLNANNVTTQSLTATNTGNSIYFGSSALYSDGYNTVIRNRSGALYSQDMNGNANAVVASQLVTPAGNGVQVGSSYFYGDSTNSAIRQNGTLYIQTPSGATADINANNVVTNGYVKVGGYASAGAGCSPNGSIGQDGSQPLFCINGVWSAATKPTTHVTWYGMPGGQNGTWDMGWHNYCALIEYDSYQNVQPEAWPVSGPNSAGQYDWNMGTCNGGGGCQGGSYGTSFICWDFN